MKNVINAIIEEINKMDELELIELNNIYALEIQNNPDGEVFANDDDFYDMLGWGGLRVAQAIHFGDYNYSHEWVTFDGYGNFKSYSFFRVDDLCELVETIAESIAENYNIFEHLFSKEIDELIKNEENETAN